MNAMDIVKSIIKSSITFWAIKYKIWPGLKVKPSMILPVFSGILKNTTGKIENMLLESNASVHGQNEM